MTTRLGLSFVIVRRPLGAEKEVYAVLPTFTTRQMTFEIFALRVSFEEWQAIGRLIMVLSLKLVLSVPCTTQGKIRFCMRELLTRITCIGWLSCRRDL